jgi:hypothetical protein
MRQTSAIFIGSGTRIDFYVADVIFNEIRQGRSSFFIILSSQFPMAKISEKKKKCFLY